MYDPTQVDRQGPDVGDQYRSVIFTHSPEQQAAAEVSRERVAGLDGSHPVTLQAKMLRLELLQVKADLERELEQLVLDCSECGRLVHWVAGLGTLAGYWAHREPAPHHEPAI